MPYEEMLGMLRGPTNPCSDPPGLTCHPGNSQTIDPNTQEDVEVIGGVLPLSWVIEGTDFTLDDPDAEGRENIIIAAGGACGSVKVIVTDFCEQELECFMRCSAGAWSLKGEFNDQCIFPGEGWSFGTNGEWEAFEYIRDNKKQTQYSYYVRTRNYETCEMEPGCFDCGAGECAEVVCQECVGDGRIPCRNEPTGPLPDRSIAYRNSILRYSEWEC